jgi:hypothetical protein
MRQSNRNWNWERGSVPPGHWKRDGVRDGDREGERRLVASFSSRCDNCSEVIEKGFELLWHPERKYRIHLACTSFFDQWAGNDHPGAARTGLPADWNKVTVRRAPGYGDPEPEPQPPSRSEPSPSAPGKQPTNTAWAEREAAKKRRYPRSGHPWSAEEEALLRRRFDQVEDLDVLADQHQRTPLGIRARLVRLGLLEE